MSTYMHLFVRSLGLIHLINFSSMISQLLPLIGSQGIAPSRLTHMRGLDLAGGNHLIMLFNPSIYWINDSDTFLVATVTIGILASLSIVCSFAHANSRVCLCTCWMILLSVCSSGGEFFSFPWDWLLLETTFLSFFLPILQSKSIHCVDPWIRHALIFLCLRFYLGMGLEKIPALNQNKYWMNLTYLSRFYVSFNTEEQV